MSGSRLGGSAPLVLLTAAALGAFGAGGAALADGPGYGGTADALTVRWQPPEDTRSEGLAVYAVGFRGGSTVGLRVGSADTRAVTADPAGAVRVLVVEQNAVASAPVVADTVLLPIEEVPGGQFAAGMTVSAVGETPAGVIRNLVGAIPPPEAGTGAQDVLRWGVAVALVAGGAGWVRRRGAGGTLLQRYRHPARHRA